MSATLAAPSVTTGQFVWHDLMTTDPERAKAFYTELLGWTVTPNDMGGGFVYEMLANAVQHFGGLMPMEAEQGIPSHWMSYVDVPDVDDAVARVTNGGGSVHVPPTDIPEVGRFAVFSDPQGASFSLITPLPNSVPVPPAGLPPIGGVSWNELMTGDVEGAKTFYADVIGWQPETSEMVEGMPYTVFKTDNRMNAGLGAKPDDMPVSMWVIYFHVADIEKSLADVTRLGGEVLFPPMDIPTVGRFSWATDPTGATFALMQEETK